MFKINFSNSKQLFKKFFFLFCKMTHKTKLAFYRQKMNFIFGNFSKSMQKLKEKKKNIMYLKILMMNNSQKKKRKPKKIINFAHDDLQRKMKICK